MEGKPYILVVDEDRDACRKLEEILITQNYNVIKAFSESEAIQKKTGTPCDLVIIGGKTGDRDGLNILRALKKIEPHLQMIVLTECGSIDPVIRAIQEGAYDFISKPLNIEELKITVKRALEQKKLLTENLYFRSELQGKYRVKNIIGSSPQMLKIYKMIGRIARSNCTVLIQGESGTGKELIARAIHFSSQRVRDPFIAIDCAFLPETLLESELFGHVKGAFTGAIATKKGLFEIAAGGTLFLDEIGNLSLTMQAKLLRVLQDRQIRRVGGIESIPIEIRVISATNRDPENMVKEGHFRDDLFYRLNVLNVHVPPLRERKEDIPLLVSHFLAKYSEINGRQIAAISSEALEIINNYDWPGNVRELEHVIERAVALTSNSQILPVDLPPKVHQGAVKNRPPLPVRRLSLKELQIKYILEVLQEVKGSKKKAAEILGINRRTLYRLSKRYGFSLHRELSGEGI